MSDDEALASGNSDGGQGTSPPLFKLEFVNVNVASEEEKRRNQKVIRSTAMRSFRRKQSQQKLKEKDGRSKVVINNDKSLISTSVRGLSLDAQDLSPQSPQSPQSTSDISEATFLEVSRLLNGSRFSINCNELSGLEWPSPTGTLSCPSSRTMSIASSPSTILGAGRIDPFRIQPVDVASNMDELIDHCEFCPTRKRSLWLVNSPGTC
jgi:hypothetical protein